MKIPAVWPGQFQYPPNFPSLEEDRSFFLSRIRFLFSIRNDPIYDWCMAIKDLVPLKFPIVQVAYGSASMIKTEMNFLSIQWYCITGIDAANYNGLRINSTIQCYFKDLLY
eukprot:TRINITY_DN596_c0_g1_i3.p1 TRINITY_DN596_c0_g1~~TRINITY_DN596_c0_g1_i3.p1  ORF type:complete len:111 (-),score=14.22 TRINITY_DN596_c0_g1_i3:717-1049(-)